MADDEGEDAPFRSDARGYPHVTGLPRLNRDPGVELAIVELDDALSIDDNAGVVRHAARIELHDGETSPDAVVDARFTKRRDLGSVQRTHDCRVRVH